MNIVDFGVVMVDRDLDTVTPEEWREMSKRQRADFINSWARRGVVSFQCLGCSFPTAHGQSTCESCR
jgi:hypothetical protein